MAFGLESVKFAEKWQAHYRGEMLITPFVITAPLTLYSQDSAPDGYTVMATVV